MKNKRFWCSWYQPTEDMRPLTFPPMTKAILAWWCSGESENDWTLCALVMATSEEQVKRRIRKEWPEAKRWRFIEEKPADWLPGDRFPITKSWEKKRLASVGSAQPQL